MIQNSTHQDRRVEGNLAGEDIQMGVSDLSHIMHVLTDLYSDRELACIREYSTNAVDAHVEAGVNVPIEVNLPGPLAPFLSIRDFGVGLSLEDIRRIYSQYGASTKRGTNSQTGMLGLGSKSALTYADQFTVTSVKDGVRIQVVVSRNTTGASMKVVDTSDTTDANGTTVTIPAKAHNTIGMKAWDFFRFWKPGSVKVGGVEPDFLPNAKWVLQDRIAIIGGSTNYVVMGGVPYPAPGLRDNLGWGQSIVAFVGIGDVDFAPNREALMDTDTTTNTLRRIEREFKDAVVKSIEDDIAKQSSPQAAIRCYLDWSRKMPSIYMPTSAKFRGKDLPSRIDVPDKTIHAPRGGYKQTEHSQLPSKKLGVYYIMDCLWVTGWDHASFTATTKKKLIKYCEDNSLTVSNFILSPQPPVKTWLSEVTFIDWPTIKAIKLPRNAPNPRTGRIPGSYDLFEDGDYNDGVPGDDIDATNSVFYLVGRYGEGRRLSAYLKKSHPGSTLVLLTSQRVAKFQRNFPKAKNAEGIVTADFEKWQKGLNKDDVIAYSVKHDYGMSDLDKLDAAKVDDPDVKRAIRTRNRDLTKLEAEIQEWRKLGCYWTYPGNSTSSPLSKYLLMPDFYYIQRDPEKMEHIYRYMNAEYAYQKAQGS